MWTCKIWSRLELQRAFRIFEEPEVLVGPHRLLLSGNDVSAAGAPDKGRLKLRIIHCSATFGTHNLSSSTALI